MEIGVLIGIVIGFAAGLLVSFSVLLMMSFADRPEQGEKKWTEQ